MTITERTYVSDILLEYGDIAEVMEIFGVKRVGGFGIRRFLTRFITVKTAAFVHRVPPENFLKMVQNSVTQKKE